MRVRVGFLQSGGLIVDAIHDPFAERLKVVDDADIRCLTYGLQLGPIRLGVNYCILLLVLFVFYN